MPFTSANIRMHLAKYAHRMEHIDDESSLPIAAVGLMLEPLTPALAKELGGEIAELCFTRQGKIRDNMTQLQCRLRRKAQRVTVRMGEDVEPHAVLRHVRISKVTVSKRGETEPSAPKSKKVTPGRAILRLTVSCLIDPAERVHRDFLSARFGATLLWTFEDEEQSLPFGHTEPVDEDPDTDLPLRPAGAEDGDILEEQAAQKATGGPQLRAVKKGETGGPNVH